MIEEGVKKGIYQKTEDTTFEDLKKFQDILYRNFYTYKHYKSMYPHSNQPAKLYGTAKTQIQQHSGNEQRKIKILP